MIAPEAVVTFDRLDGFRIVRSYGIASGEAVCPHSLLRATMRSIGAFIGVVSIEYITDAERARSECLRALCKQAEAAGANGVVGVRFAARERPDGSTHVMATGEAVVLERVEAPSA